MILSKRLCTRQLLLEEYVVSNAYVYNRSGYVVSRMLMGILGPIDVVCNLFFTFYSSESYLFNQLNPLLNKPLAGLSYVCLPHWLAASTFLTEGGRDVTWKFRSL